VLKPWKNQNLSWDILIIGWNHHRLAKTYWPDGTDSEGVLGYIGCLVHIEEGTVWVET
jgi:hypothetical protein